MRIDPLSESNESSPCPAEAASSGKRVLPSRLDPLRVQLFGALPTVLGCYEACVVQKFTSSLFWRPSNSGMLKHASKAYNRLTYKINIFLFLIYNEEVNCQVKF